MGKYLIIWMVLCLPLMGWGQEAKPGKQEKADSLQSIQAASAAIDLLVKERAMRIQDSIEQASLKSQIEQAVSAQTRRMLERELARKQEADSLRSLAIKEQIERNKHDAIGYPVVVAADTVRVVYAPFGVLTASERAENYEKKIKEIAGVFIPSIDSLVIRPDELNIEVLFKERVMCTVTQADAMWVDKDQMQLAGEIAAATRSAIVKYQDMTSVSTILKQIGLSVLVIAGCILVVYFINRVFRRKVRRFMLSRIGTWFNGWHIRDYEFLPAKRQVRFVIFIMRTFRVVLSLLVLYITLPLLFSIFPFTKRLADTLFGWIIQPVKFIFWAVVDYIPNLFVIIVIWFTVKYVMRGIKYIMNEIGEGRLKINGFYPDWAGATYNIIRFLIYAFGFVMMFPYLPGSDSEIFKGVSVFVGIIFSLGSSSAISNVVAGMVITYMRPFKVGDHVKIVDTTGDVLEKTPFVTRIKTHNKEVVTIPNSTILAASVINYSTSAAEKGIIFHVSVTIGYDVPWRKVHQMMIEAALRSDYILKDPAPFVLQTSLDDFYVSYQLCTYSRHPGKQAGIYSQLNQNIQDVFFENNIEIMSPHYRAERDGSAPAIPR